MAAAMEHERNEHRADLPCVPPAFDQLAQLVQGCAAALVNRGKRDRPRLAALRVGQRDSAGPSVVVLRGGEGLDDRLELVALETPVGRSRR